MVSSLSENALDGVAVAKIPLNPSSIPDTTKWLKRGRQGMYSATIIILLKYQVPSDERTET